MIKGYNSNNSYVKSYFSLDELIEVFSLIDKKCPHCAQQLEGLRNKLKANNPFLNESINEYLNQFCNTIISSHPQHSKNKEDPVIFLIKIFLELRFLNCFSQKIIPITRKDQADHEYIVLCLENKEFRGVVLGVLKLIKANDKFKDLVNKIIKLNNDDAKLPKTIPVDSLKIITKSDLSAMGNFFETMDILLMSIALAFLLKKEKEMGRGDIELKIGTIKQNKDFVIAVAIKPEKEELYKKIIKEDRLGKIRLVKIKKDLFALFDKNFFVNDAWKFVLQDDGCVFDDRDINIEILDEKKESEVLIAMKGKIKTEHDVKRETSPKDKTIVVNRDSPKEDKKTFFGFLKNTKDLTKNAFSFLKNKIIKNKNFEENMTNDVEVEDLETKEHKNNVLKPSSQDNNKNLDFFSETANSNNVMTNDDGTDRHIEMPQSVTYVPSLKEQKTKNRKKTNNHKIKKDQNIMPVVCVKKEEQSSPMSLNEEHPTEEKKSYFKKNIGFGDCCDDSFLGLLKQYVFVVLSNVFRFMYVRNIQKIIIDKFYEHLNKVKSKRDKNSDESAEKTHNISCFDNNDVVINLIEEDGKQSSTDPCVVGVDDSNDASCSSVEQNNTKTEEDSGYISDTDTDSVDMNVVDMNAQVQQNTLIDAYNVSPLFDGVACEQTI